jgi:hypothetical protein
MIRADVAASQPHRRSIRSADQADAKAESELGRMCLQGYISDAGYAAGQVYARVVAAYRVTICTPVALVGMGGRGYDCPADPMCGDRLEGCECARRRNRYDGACEALRSAGADIKVVNEVAVHDGPCRPEWIMPLRWGLAALVRHFG